MGFRVPTASVTRSMHNTDNTPNDLAGIRIYDGDELIFDGDDPTTYVICETAEQIESLFAKIAAGCDL